MLDCSLVNQATNTFPLYLHLAGLFPLATLDPRGLQWRKSRLSVLVMWVTCGAAVAFMW